MKYVCLDYVEDKRHLSSMSTPAEQPSISVVRCDQGMTREVA
jgi:hypothetical protein